MQRFIRDFSGSDLETFTLQINILWKRELPQDFWVIFIFLFTVFCCNSNEQSLPLKCLDHRANSFKNLSCFHYNKFASAMSYFVSLLYYCNLVLIFLRLLQAKPLVGSTLLVREGDRPELEEDEFYTRDLVGMKVFMKVCTLCG